MPSRQKQRKARSDAAKAADTAAALANLHVSVGDWTSQVEDPNALVRAISAETLRKMSDDGDRNAQYSLGRQLVMDASRFTSGWTSLSSARRTAKAEVGWALRTDTFKRSRSLTSHTETRRTVIFIAGATTGAKAEAWCLLIHADASLSLSLCGCHDPGRMRARRFWKRRQCMGTRTLCTRRDASTAFGASMKTPWSG
jgi:hypothetical protein